jgi:Mrp family chromosome partitioning ATPase
MVDGESVDGHVFVSYAHADEGYVQRLVDDLRSRGVNVWWDRALLAGEQWSPILAEKIDTCAAFLVVMTPEAEASTWVAREIIAAEKSHRPIIPLLVAGDPLFTLAHLQFEPVLAGMLPGEGFVDRLRAVMTGGGPALTGISGPRYVVGVVPNPAGAFQPRQVADEVYTALGGAGTVILSGESTRAQILSGLGGVGKTQLAADLARRLRVSGAVQALFWVTALDRPAIVAGYAAAADEVRTATGVGDADAAARAFHQWLSRTDARWLLVLDDLTDPADLHDLWPPESSSGRTVVTTRRRDASLKTHGALISVGVFTPGEAAQYLAGRLDRDPTRLDGADDLARQLGYLPLALGQAATYIDNQNLTCATYGHRFTAARDVATVLPKPQSVDQAGVGPANCGDYCRLAVLRYGAQ